MKWVNPASWTHDFMWGLLFGYLGCLVVLLGLAALSDGGLRGDRCSVSDTEGGVTTTRVVPCDPRPAAP